jgi:hypothetical protein
VDTADRVRSRVVKEAIKDGGGDGAIAVEDSRPLFKGTIHWANSKTLSRPSCKTPPQSRSNEKQANKI